MTTDTHVDIDIYKLQQQFHNDPKGAAQYVYQRLLLAGIPVDLQPGNRIVARRGTLLINKGAVYLHYRWIPSDQQLNFGDVLKHVGDNL